MDFDRNSGKLNGTLRDVGPAFGAAVRKGRYRKVSAASFLPDSAANPVPGTLYLRYLGFLGGAPSQREGAAAARHAYIERYNRTVRHEWLDQYIIETIEEAQDFATQWLWTYNNDRPNMGIGGITPAQKLKMAA